MKGNWEEWKLDYPIREKERRTWVLIGKDKCFLGSVELRRWHRGKLTAVPIRHGEKSEVEIYLEHRRRRIEMKEKKRKMRTKLGNRRSYLNWNFFPNYVYMIIWTGKKIILFYLVETDWLPSVKKVIVCADFFEKFEDSSSSNIIVHICLLLTADYARTWLCRLCFFVSFSF